AWQDLNAGW
uniref:Locustamyoinhibiting peptide n=1 Tax=Locusta migratoria TaxID=7004 RepID=LMIP_LOCMI|nr:RecName: Full=Locustamyoinhibiting peptide; AltName: Full=LOM-MIP [Locusta migratoria]